MKSASSSRIKLQSRRGRGPLLARNGNSGEGEEHRTPYRLSKDLRRGKYAEDKVSSNWEAGLAISVSGDDFVVVDPAFSVDERLHNHRIIAVCNAPGRLERGVKETGIGRRPKGFIPRQKGLRGCEHANQQRHSTQQGNGAGEAGRNLPHQGTETVLPANPSAGEFLLRSIGRLLRQGNAKPKAQIGRSFGRSDAN